MVMKVFATMPPLGKLIKREREACGWSQERLAAVSGVRYTSVAKIEGGFIAEPGWSTVRKLARALGLTIDELVKEADDPPPPPPKTRKLGK